MSTSTFGADMFDNLSQIVNAGGYRSTSTLYDCKGTDYLIITE